MLKITLKDGSVKEYEDKITPLEIVKGIGKRLEKAAVAAEINNVVCDLDTEITKDSTLNILTNRDDKSLGVLRHSSSHVLAQAVKRLFPDTKLAIGPAIDNGFYYDFDSSHTFSPEDLEKIEAEMAKIIKEAYNIERFEMIREEAIEYMKEKNEPYKVELIEDLPDDSVISFYKQGEFVDLCAGPHVLSTSKVKAIKLLNVAGAYWRGNENNKMLQRIYGTSFFKKSHLEEYIKRLEEAKKRDHRKLGKELDLYSINEVGPGFPFFHPKGMVLRNQLENFWRQEHEKRGYQEVKTPIILNRQLWIQSGHWDHYKENMYFTKIDEEDFAVKPMNCPGGMMIFKRDIVSYRDLPIRIGELGLVHRHELSGALHGLMRVRCFTQDDAHIFMLPDQIKDEIIGVIDKIDYFYNLFGFKYNVELSTRPEDSMGSDEDWQRATSALKDALETKGMNYTINEGDGAFYGPKIDFHLEDSIGRTWQCGTIQLDFQMPERFDLNYIGDDGEKHRPVMIHTVAFGSIERFIGILTEHFAGAFPVWLAPVQVRILAITDRSNEYIKEVEQKLRDLNVRVETDLRNEKIGYKIREARTQRIPYILVVGDKEIEKGAVAVRERTEGDIGAVRVEDFVERITKEIDEKAM